MRLRRKHSPAISLVFPTALYAADELLATLTTEHARRARKAQLRAEALGAARRNR